MVTISLFLQNLSVAINCGLVVVLIAYKAAIEAVWDGNRLGYCLQGLIILFNIISKLSSMAAKIAIERDWIIVIAKSAYDASDEEGKNLRSEKKVENRRDFKHELASINATVRRIDLFTAILSPLVAGLIMSFFNFSPRLNGTVVSAIFFGIWNIISFLIEYGLLASVYRSVPELEKPKVIKNADEKDKNKILKFISSFKKIRHGWAEYFSQGLVLIPSLALSVLYLTVLSFDGITIGYAKSQKLTETTISLFQGVGSIMGILGTIAFPLFHNRFKIYLPYIGFIGSLFQVSLLSICFISIWLPGSPFTLANQYLSTQINRCNDSFAKTMTNFANESSFVDNSSLFVFDSTGTNRIFFESPCYVYTSVIVLLSGMALSRFGLWLTDLVIHQIIQESVDEKKRGIIGGVQNSLNTIFDLIKYASVIFLSDVSQYGYLTIISICAVFAAFCLYTSFTVAKCVTRDKKPNDYLKPTTQLDDEDEDGNSREMQVISSNA